MKRNPKGAKRERRQIRVYDFDEARAALPYLSSVVRSLREHRLDAVAHHRTAERIARRPGRPDRAALVAHAEATRAADEADGRLRDTLEELAGLDVYCLDPIAGQALIPFVRDEELAWYVFDLFDPEPLRFWRKHSDPMETRRPLAEAQAGPAEEATWIA
jgi:hypothetical protein